MPGILTQVSTELLCGVLGHFEGFELVCGLALGDVVGDNLDIFSPRAKVKMFTQFPSGTSSRALVHYGQSIRYKKLQKFNHDDRLDKGELAGEITKNNDKVYEAP